MNLAIVQWWANADFAVHCDMNSHTGATMTLGKGTIKAISLKQKLNTKSSTKAELVAADDTMSHLLQTKYFLEAQCIYQNKPSFAKTTQVQCF